MDLVQHHSSSSSGSSSSSSSFANGSTEVTPVPTGTPLCTHTNISSITNPSLSSSSLNAKRKLVEIAPTDEAQLPRLSAAQCGDVYGISSGPTMDSRADADEGGDSANEEKSDEEAKSESVAGSDNNSKQHKKKTKRQKRKAKQQSADKESIIAEARSAWDQLKSKHKLCMEAADECAAFDTMKDMRMKGETKRDFRIDFMNAEQRFDKLNAEVIASGRRLNQILLDHPAVLRMHGQLGDKPPSGRGTFDEEFQIL